MSEFEEKPSPGDAGNAASITLGSTSPAGVVVATWLSKSLLVMVGDFHMNPGDTRTILVADNESLEVAVRCISFQGTQGMSEFEILTAAIVDDSMAARTAEKLSIGGGQVEGDVIELTITDLDTIVNDRLSGLGDAVARRVLEFISAAPTAHGFGNECDLVLSSRLHILRKALRPQLPAVAIGRDQALTGNVDALVTIDDSAFFMSGWMRDGEAKVVRFTAVTPEGERVELLGRLCRRELPEFEIFADGPYREPVDGAQFIAYFETSRPSRLRGAWIFELQNETNRVAEMYALPEVPNVDSARTKILRSVSERDLPDEQLMGNHVFPAIERLQERARDAVKVAHVADYGAPVESPEVSIIVPLYQRIDLVEHQILQFDRDPEIQAQELIYVLDSPELESDLADRARQLVRLYDVPFRVVTMAHNVGFGAATNAGASVARGRLLLLLNSDVLPAEPGWLGKMRAFHDATPNLGALGPKLLYEDDSLQHAGLYFDIVQEGPTAGSWANMHYFKGLHRDLPAANVARPVPAVTAACLLIEKDLYEGVGGLPDVYVQGDYEDSELCMRLLEAGRDNWYLPAAELYHLEGSSYSESERGITGSYNRWLQTHRLGQAIEDAMVRYPRI